MIKKPAWVSGVTALIALIIVGCGYWSQVRATSLFEKQFPPSGKWVQVQGHRMHLDCTGEGSPTVLLDAGNGRMSLDWSFVQPELAKTTRVCSFDRPGYGWSDPVSTPRTGKNIVAEEQEILERAGERGPYLLVGHSGGGMYARLFAKYHPEAVAGMVLLDSAAVAADTFDPLEEFQNKQWQQFRVMKWLATVGFLPIVGHIAGEDVIPEFVLKLSKNTQQIYLAGMARPFYFDTLAREGRELDSQQDEVWQELSSISTFGVMPLVVISAQSTVPNDATPQASEINAYLRESQKTLLNLSSSSRQIIAENSHHDIHLDEPEVVIKAVQQMIKGIR